MNNQRFELRTIHHLNAGFSRSAWQRNEAARSVSWLRPVLVAALSLTLAGRLSAQVTVLHTFTGPPSDGATPDVGLLVSGDSVFGTTIGGGSSSNGIVFAVHTGGFHS